ncbi:Transcription initiation factor TFIID subunit 13 [Phytophthora boehmeriae]|uniref:Transcription initiation factor TFIID subunit 13 n=1 Tax=Phytophthora boehmeriae TaxID=109152 RepID=A0A8T1X3X8_9STRA|nr:Transcription initiation factor TFIID subunit 13 [Phytophthora boehmeriae]
MLDAQDVVGESCGSQFDSDASALLSARSERPFLASTSVKAADFPGSGLWQKHIQRDEAKPQRHSVDEWQNRDSQRFKTHQSASAMVLARKRKRDEQRRKGGDKRQCTDSDGTSELNGDSERDSLDMEEQLTAFVEYNSTDMDSLDINPSQDFDGDITDDVGQGIASQASQYMQTCGWEDLTDVTQFHEEASEVFDST